MNFDLYLFNIINGLAEKYRWLDNFGIFFAGYFEYVFFAVLFYVLWKSNNGKGFWDKRLAMEVLLSGIISRGIVTEIIRFFWQRLRPFEILSNINLLLPYKIEASFPSGHAILFFALATTIYFYNKRVGVWLFAGSALMGLGRIFVGYHWPSDILAGAILGVLIAIITNKFFKKINKKYENYIFGSG